jgi:hypothetical protein
MTLQDAVGSQLIEIIEWTDDSRETLSYRKKSSAAPS